MNNTTVEVKKECEDDLIKGVSREICQYFGFHDETIGESFYRALKRGDFQFIRLKNENKSSDIDD